MYSKNKNIQSISRLDSFVGIEYYSLLVSKCMQMTQNITLYMFLRVCRCRILLYTGVYVYINVEYYSILVSTCIKMQNITLYWCLRVYRCRILLYTGVCVIQIQNITLYWCLRVYRFRILLYNGVYVYIDLEYYSLLMSPCMQMQNITLQ